MIHDGLVSINWLNGCNNGQQYIIPHLRYFYMDCHKTQEQGAAALWPVHVSQCLRIQIIQLSIMGGAVNTGLTLSSEMQQTKKDKHDVEQEVEQHFEYLNRKSEVESHERIKVYAAELRQHQLDLLREALLLACEPSPNSSSALQDNVVIDCWDARLSSENLEFTTDMRCAYRPGTIGTVHQS